MRQFYGSPVLKTPRFHELWAQALVRELRSHMYELN